MNTSATVESLLEPIRRQLGFLPNLFKELSKSPATLQVYLKGQEALSQGQLSPGEQHIVQLTVAVFNQCEYCQAAHAWLCRKVGLSIEDIRAIRSDQPSGIAPELANIVRATRLILEQRGWLDQGEISRLEGEGIHRGKLYEIIAFIGLKTITNYINHLAHTPVDEPFLAWEKG